MKLREMKLLGIGWQIPFDLTIANKYCNSEPKQVSRAAFVLGKNEATQNREI